MRPYLPWAGVCAAAVAGGVVWAWLLNVVGPTYVWSIGVILIGVYYHRRARTEFDRNFTLFVTVYILGIVLAAALLNALDKAPRRLPRAPETNRDSRDTMLNRGP